MTVAVTPLESPGCGVTETQQGLPNIYTEYLRQTYDREIDILDSNFVKNDPHYRYAREIEMMVPRLDDESERAHAERIISVTRRLTDLELLPSAQNVRDSIGAIHNARERYEHEPIFKETILFLSGAVTTHPGRGESVYATPDVMRRLRELGHVQHFTGLLPQREDCAWSTRESLEEARGDFLDAIRATRTPLTILIRGHGSEDYIEIGVVNEAGTPETIALTGAHLARAIADRSLQIERETRSAHTQSDVVILFDDCYIHPLATATLLNEIEEISREEGRDIPIPSIITAVDRGQVAFRGQLMEHLLFNEKYQTPVFGMLYPDNDLIGNREQNSNATLAVRDRRGRPLQIG